MVVWANNQFNKLRKHEAIAALALYKFSGRASAQTRAAVSCSCWLMSYKLPSAFEVSVCRFPINSLLRDTVSE